MARTGRVRDGLRALAERLSGRKPARAPRARRNLGSYYQPPCGIFERSVCVRPTALVAPARSTYEALRDHVIRDFGHGENALAAIVSHVLGTKLGARGRLDMGAFWHASVTVTVRCELTQASSGVRFDTLRPATLGDIAPELGEPHRVADIEAYAERLRAGEALGRALYVSGALLDRVSGRRLAAPCGLYMLDGARRLSAAALAGRATAEVLLVLDETELPDMLARARLVDLARRVETLDWFRRYQSLPLVGIAGERTQARFSLMDLTRLRDALVLDFGCNTGAACHKAVQAGARRVVGIEGMADTYALARDIAAAIGFERLALLHVDFNAPDFDRRIDESVPERADYSFLFSVYRTRELTERERLFRYVIAKTRRGIFFEGHADREIDTPAYHQWLFDCLGLGRYRLLGHSEGELRPLYFIALDG